MKDTVEKLKTTASSTYVRSATAAAVLVPIAAIAGGIPLKNHNETLVDDRAAPRTGDEETQKPGTLAATTYVRAAAVATALVPIAAIAGGMNLGNHNETLLRSA